jgi:type II secretory pathway predicted ATPase ExeA
MPKHHSSLSSRAFGQHADPRLIVAYQSHQDVLRFLASALGQPNGIALLQGPAGSGKTTILNEQRDWSSRNTATALIDGTQLTPRQLLDSILSQFRVKVVSPQDDQWLPRLNSFLTQETRRGHTPVLIIDNADRATESALRLLDWLAALQAGSQYALRIVLAGRELSSLPHYGSLHSLVRRNPATYSLNPMSAHESMTYLRTRFIAAGGTHCEIIFSLDVCDKLRELSRGWPGELNKLATEIVERTVERKPEKPKPRIIISRDGEVMAEHELSVQKYVIGRSDLSDIVVEDSFVSKTHALLQVYPSAIVLLDLNSTNGTTVNSRVVYQTILKSNDIISLGRHRLKIENAPVLSPQLETQIRTSDTVTMQNLAGLRRSRALRTIQSLKKR